MAEKILNTRIQLKHDTLANWQEKDTLLKKGEIAIAVIEGIDPSNKLHQPVMFKVGPGNFNNLEWASALAADVYAWAKKPSLDANDLPEIPGLKLGISFEVVGEGNALTNVAYDTTSKKFTFTKGETFATKQELEDVVANGTVVAEGAKIDVALDGNTYTVSHEAIAQAEAGKTVAARTYITGVTTDGYGHITGYTTATEEDQDTGVMLIHGVDAIGVDNTNSAEPHILLKLDDNAGNVELTQSMAGLKANIDLGEYAKLSDVPGIKVDNAVDADKLGGQDPTYYATATALANVLAEAKQYADDNDANETFAISYANNTITLTGSNGTNSSFDASAFVKDSYLKEVDYNDITNVLTFTFIDNEDKLQAIPVDLTDLVDVYDADEITLTKTDATFSVKDGGISKTKLDSNVQASLDKADTALQAHQDISGKADKVSGATNGNFAGLDANGNLVDSGKKAADFATADQGEKADTAFGWGDHAQAGYDAPHQSLSQAGGGQ